MTIIIYNRNTKRIEKASVTEYDLRMGKLAGYDMPRVASSLRDGDVRRCRGRHIWKMHQNPNVDYLLVGSLFWGTHFGSAPGDIDFLALPVAYRPSGQTSPNYTDREGVMYRQVMPEEYRSDSMFVIGWHINRSGWHRTEALGIHEMVPYDKAIAEDYRKVFLKFAKSGLLSITPRERHHGLWTLFLEQARKERCNKSE
ncbi:MAG: hypothetical protein OEY01_03385 [Desulfobulbaceae bacterium]|nr:hypothetical protein [Desulfobulbaceae bacterium]